mmetsp:Transcript_31260/g.67148  ORF Transcript_31260/g.67148 Transcript_31260/m.67148 type:complete len:329 (+) Transcript_31260:350-1336(+)|eukprot:CAMPEP_0183352436 /NCGR_PEP_ID=MMETSP0164_2-20130417/29435_1 /TAXON_ID=221442 /ORGANISM="Coccolithus pelagicus ssp braarudi, Strain PLY182g" /LENGTH=328 /DNA_ID=CAMNT_0025524865 /DNA_START=248 /DNA_END=1234 /DNA_ORIENTATION=-
MVCKMPVKSHSPSGLLRWPLSRRERQVVEGALLAGRGGRPEDAQRDARPRLWKELVYLVRGADGLVADKEQHVIGPHPSEMRGRAWEHLPRHERVRLGGAGLALEGAREGAHLGVEAEVGAAHVAAGEQLGHHPLRCVGGHREGEVLRARDDGGVDAKDGAEGVHQRPARVTWVKSNVCLDDSFYEALVLRAQRSANGGDDTGRDGGLETERIANGHHQLPHHQLLRVTERGIWQPRPFELHECEISGHIATDRSASQHLPVCERRRHRVRLADHVRIRENVPIGRDDHSAPSAATASIWRAGHATRGRHIDRDHCVTNFVYHADDCL